MYAVFFSTDFNKDLTDPKANVKLFKRYKNLTPALKCAYGRNQLISSHIEGRTYFVYDPQKKVVLSARKEEL